MQSPAARLRPMGIGELVDEAVNIYRAHLRLFLTIAVTFIAPLAVVQLLEQLAIHRSGGSGTTVLSSMLVDLVAAAVYLATYAALAIAAAELWQGRTLTANDAFSRGLDRIWSLFGLAILFFLAVGVMVITIIGIPLAIYFIVAWSVAFPALLIEGIGARQAMGRSRDLVRGHWWRVVGVTIVVSIIAGIVRMVLSLPGLALGGAALLAGNLDSASATVVIWSILAGAAAVILTIPFVMAATVLLYFDLRSRKEGYDLELRARETGFDGRPTGAAG